MLDLAAYRTTVELRLRSTSPIDGYDGSARSHGGRRVAALGPAHGPERISARFRRGPAALSRQRLEQSIQRFWRRSGADRAASEQYGDGSDDSLIRHRWRARTRAGACDHARRKCWHDAD